MKKTLEERFWEKVDKKSDEECWNWASVKNKQGYGQFSVKSKKYIAHRFSWILHYDFIPEGMFVCHSCDNPSCVNPKHLFLGTRSDNMQDMWNKNRHPAPIIGNKTEDMQGEKNIKARLNSNDVLKIRKMYKDGVSQIELSALYAVQTPAIWKIVHNRNWVHI